MFRVEEIVVDRRDGVNMARLVVDDHQGAVRRGQQGVGKRSRIGSLVIDVILSS